LLLAAGLLSPTDWIKWKLACDDEWMMRRQGHGFLREELTGNEEPCWLCGRAGFSEIVDRLMNYLLRGRVRLSNAQLGIGPVASIPSVPAQ
jgi:hypothetical protein